MECNTYRYSCRYCNEEQQVYEEMLKEAEMKKQEVEENTINLREWLSPELLGEAPVVASE